MGDLECTELKGVNMPKNKQSKKRLSKELKEFFKTGDLQSDINLYALKGNIPELLELWKEHQVAFMTEWRKIHHRKNPWILNFIER